MNPLPRTRPAGEKIILWDAPGVPPPENEGVVFTWNRSSDSQAVSLLDYVEENGERFREIFLKWSASLGILEISGKSLIEHLSLGDGFSYWWMCPLVEKSPWKFPWIKDALRLFALEEILGEQKPQTLVLVSHDRRLRKVLARLCKIQRINFQPILPGTADVTPPVQTGFGRRLPHVLQGLATLVRQVWIRRDFLSQGPGTWKGGKQATTIFSYFFHLEPGSQEYRSRFWGELSDLVRNLTSPVNWVHMFYPHADIPTAKEAIHKTDGFNERATEHEMHTFIDSFLSWSIVARTLKNWIHLIFVSRHLDPLLSGSSEKPLWFWQLIADDWTSTLQGSRAVMNLLWKELFDAALATVPRQSLGIYLWENQPWEQAWIHSWRRHGHGKLVGVAHSTMRFWDLRYFGFESSAVPSAQFPRPLPDIVAINGNGMLDAISGSEVPFEVRECEALRFAYLQPFCESPERQQTGKAGICRILVLGDYLPAETTRMLDLLAAAGPGLNADFSFTLKPHPNHTPDLSRHEGLTMDVVSAPLVELLPFYDVAYVSNITSAGLDAYLAGLPVIVLHPSDDLNYSPLRNWKDVRFVADRAGLLNALDEITTSPPSAVGRKDFFRFDSKLTGWRNLLAPDSEATNKPV